MKTKLKLSFVHDIDKCTTKEELTEFFSLRNWLMNSKYIYNIDYYFYWENNARYVPTHIISMNDELSVYLKLIHG